MADVQSTGAEHGPHELFETEGFMPGAYADFDARLTFADARGKQFECRVHDIVAAFLAMASEFYLPNPGGAWPVVLDAKDQGASDGFCALMPMASGDCTDCGAEIHAVFQQNETRFLVERWSIMSTVLVLIDQAILPKLPHKWYWELERCFEQVCQTGRHHVSRTCGEAGRV